MPSLRSALERYLDGWRERLPGAWLRALGRVEPDFDAIPGDALLSRSAKIVPDPPKRVFHALDGIDPSDVNVVVFGNDPYPDPCRATGRSFEQGNLTDWIADLAECDRVTPSLLNLARAAGALYPGANGLRLDSPDIARCNRAPMLLQALHDNSVVLSCPPSMFENLTRQGVLWINRTPTISPFDTGNVCRGTTWRKPSDCERAWHRDFWRPVTHAILSALVQEAQDRAVVIALFGGEAREIGGCIESLLGHPVDQQENLCVVESGHPSMPQHFFQYGNPLERINDELDMRHCNRIDWYGSPAE